MNNSPAPRDQKRPDRRRKLTAQLHERELDDLDYILAFAEIARTRLNDLDVEDEPILTADMPDEQRAEAVNRLADYELRAEFRRTFGTLQLPDTKADVARLALRLLARTIKESVITAGQRATEADPVHRNEADEWAATSAAMMDKAFEENSAAQETGRTAAANQIREGSPSPGTATLGADGGPKILDPDTVEGWTRHTRFVVSALTRSLVWPAALIPPASPFSESEFRVPSIAPGPGTVPKAAGFEMQIQSALTVLSELRTAQIDLAGTVVASQFRKVLVSDVAGLRNDESKSEYLAKVTDAITRAVAAVERDK